MVSKFIEWNLRFLGGGGKGIFSLDEVDWGFIMIIGDLELRGTNFEGGPSVIRVLPADPL